MMARNSVAATVAATFVLVAAAARAEPGARNDAAARGPGDDSARRFDSAGLRTAPVHVDDAPPEGSGPSDAEVRARVARIERSFRDNEAAEQRWHWGWIAGLGSLAVGQGIALGFVDDPARRAALIYGTTASTLGAVGPLAFGNPALGAADELAAMPARTPGERRAKLARAERLLRESARITRLGRSPWLSFALPVTAATAMATYIYVEYDDPAVAGTQLGSSLAISLARWLSRPGGNLRTAEVLEARVVVVPAPGGVALAGAF